MKSYIHIDSTAIQKHWIGVKVPILSVLRGGKTFTGYRVRIDGPSEVVFNPGEKLFGKYQCWIETESPIYLDDVLVPEEGLEPPTSAL